MAIASSLEYRNFEEGAVHSCIAGHADQCCSEGAEGAIRSLDNACGYLYLGLRAPEEGFNDLGCDLGAHC